MALPVVLLIISFLLKVKRFGSFINAVHDIDMSYPFSPRHRPLYRSLRMMYKSNEILGAKILTVRQKVDVLHEDVNAAREQIGNLGTQSNKDAVHEILNRLEGSISEIEKEISEDVVGMSSDIVSLEEIRSAKK